ncbi:expansin EXLX1 family cellulose-binding protein [Nocardia thraciensis]
MHRVTQQQHIRAARPWLFTALAVGVVVAAALWVSRPEPAVCRTSPGAAARPAPPAPLPSITVPQLVAPVEQRDPAQPGEARYYSFNQGVACSFPELPLDGFYIGVPTEEYAGSAACGALVELEGPLGSVRAQIVDRCPGCAPGQYDLSTAAFTRIADRSSGVAPIQLRRVRNPVPIPELVYRVKDGSSAHWLGLLFGNAGNPLSRVEIRPDAGGAGVTLTRGMDNYWSISGAGPGPFTALVTDVEGHQVRVPGIEVNSGEIRHTEARLYDIPAPPPAARPAPVPMATTTTIDACS